MRRWEGCTTPAPRKEAPRIIARGDREPKSTYIVLQRIPAAAATLSKNAFGGRSAASSEIWRDAWLRLYSSCMIRASC